MRKLTYNQRYGAYKIKKVKNAITFLAMVLYKQAF